MPTSGAGAAILSGRLATSNDYEMIRTHVRRGAKRRGAFAPAPRHYEVLPDEAALLAHHRAMPRQRRHPTTSSIRPLTPKPSSKSRRARKTSIVISMYVFHVITKNQNPAHEHATAISLPPFHQDKTRPRPRLRLATMYSYRPKPRPDRHHARFERKRRALAASC